MPTGIYIRTKECRESISKAMKGHTTSEETRKKIGMANSVSLKGKKQSLETIEKRAFKLRGRKRPPFSLEWRMNLSKSTRGKKRHSSEYKKFLSDKMKNNIFAKTATKIAWERILKEIPKLEEGGFRCIPIGKPIPDIIALKDGKVYAVEVEYGNSDYEKYTEETKKYYDDVIWIRRKVGN